jgi:hypothetical protein
LLTWAHAVKQLKCDRVPFHALELSPPNTLLCNYLNQVPPVTVSAEPLRPRYFTSDCAIGITTAAALHYWSATLAVYLGFANECLLYSQAGLLMCGVVLLYVGYSTFRTRHLEVAEKGVHKHSKGTSKASIM